MAALSASGNTYDPESLSHEKTSPSNDTTDEKVRIKEVTSLWIKTWFSQENSSDLTDRATKLNNYYENLRTNVMSILGQVREPIIPPPPGSNGSIPVTGSNPVGISGVVANTQDQFDSYLTKLQTICSENGGGAGDPNKPPSYCGSVGGVNGAPKTALQAYNSAAKI